jgi:ribosomal protein L24E
MWDGDRLGRGRGERGVPGQGKTYYFCSQACHQQFVAAPEQYAV